MVEKIVAEDLKLTPKHVYDTLYGGIDTEWYSLIAKVATALLDKVDGKDEEGKRNWMSYYETVATDITKRYLIKMSYKCFDTNDRDKSYTYMKRAFMIFTGCTYEQAIELTNGFISAKNVHDCLFDHLFNRNINLCNCKEVRFEAARGLPPNFYIIRTVRDHKKYDLSIHCDYWFDDTKSVHNMFIDMYSSDKETEAEV
jgi:hypothetical protein